MFLKRLHLACALAGFYIISTTASAFAGTEVFLNISKKFSQKIRIAVPYFTAASADKQQAAKAAEQLVNDLSLSGYFSPVKERSFIEENQRDDAKSGKINAAEWKRIGADMVVKGTYDERGGKIAITCAVYAMTDGKRIFEKSYTDSASARRLIVHRIADDIVKQLTGERGIAQTKAVFVMGSGKKREVCIMDYDGHNAKKLTHDNALALYPKLSPDGRKIVYTAYLNNRPQIFLIDLARNSRTLLSSSPGLNATASFSPTRDEIALTLSRDGNPEIYLKDLSDGSLTRLTNDRAVDSSPSWSPDGNRIVFVSNRSGSPQLYVMDRNGGGIRRLTYRGSYNATPAWSPKGDLVAFASQMGREFQICTVNAANGEQDIITSDGRDNEDPSWAPDGRHIMYTSTKGNKSALFIIDIYDKDPIQLPGVSANVLNPDWSK
jgi:TolB protein